MEVAVFALLQKCQCLSVGLEPDVQLCFQLAHAAVGVCHSEQGVYPVVGLARESLYLPLPLDNQSHGHALHASCRERGLHLAPQYRRELEAHQPVENPARLLRIHQVHVQMAWCLNGLEYGRLGYFVEDDALGLFLVKAEHLAQMP